MGEVLILSEHKINRSFNARLNDAQCELRFNAASISSEYFKNVVQYILGLPRLYPADLCKIMRAKNQICSSRSFYQWQEGREIPECTDARVSILTLIVQAAIQHTS